ncbi:MAG TPA: carboxypeptidase-like regulatory domain-containing protein [Kofleriaceae bacterium]|nr:carboxypeptidase-like regulatory domain-containing protein [Kofleriaceae bacterium]
MRMWIALGLVVSACSSNHPASPDAPPADAPPIDAAPAVLSGTVTDESSNPIAGAKVCILGHPEVACATTDANGGWTLEVPFLPPPPPIELAWSYTATGYLGFVGLEDEAVAGAYIYYSSVPLFDDTMATAMLATQAGFTYPNATAGFVQVRVHGPIGSTAALSPASGSGPVYTRTDGTPDPTLTGTQAIDAMVYFGNVAPGTYDVGVTGAQVTCYDRGRGETNPIAGDWAPTGSGAIGVEVAAGEMTQGLNVYCY